jgi:hypothetical protein
MGFKIPPEAILKWKDVNKEFKGVLNGQDKKQKKKI